MTFRIINTDNFGGDYPDEKFVMEPEVQPIRRLPGCKPLEYTTELEAQTQADVLNGPYPEHSSRYYKVVEMPYELAPGFEP